MKLGNHRLPAGITNELQLLTAMLSLKLVHTHTHTHRHTSTHTEAHLHKHAEYTNKYIHPNLNAVKGNLRRVNIHWHNAVMQL